MSSFPRGNFKTKLCNAFSRGHCNRDPCSFAHGDQELRKGNYSAGGSSKNYSSYSRDRFSGFDRNRIARSRSRSPSHRHGGSDERSRRRSSSDSMEAKRARLDTIDNAPEKGPHDRERTRMFDRSADQNSDDIYLSDEVKILSEKLRRLEEKVESKSTSVANLNSQIAELDNLILSAKEQNQEVFEKLKRLVKAQQKVNRSQDESKKYQARLVKLVSEFELDFGKSLDEPEFENEAANRMMEVQNNF